MDYFRIRPLALLQRRTWHRVEHSVRLFDLLASPLPVRFLGAPGLVLGPDSLGGLNCYRRNDPGLRMWRRVAGIGSWRTRWGWADFQEWQGLRWERSGAPLAACFLVGEPCKAGKELFWRYAA